MDHLMCKRMLIKAEFLIQQKEGAEIHYLKVHAPYEVLTRYAEILKVRMPVKKVSKSS